MEWILGLWAVVIAVFAVAIGGLLWVGWQGNE